MRSRRFQALAGFAVVACLAMLYFTRYDKARPSNADVLNGTAALATNASGFYTTPVMLNGAGPFTFVVDTGANFSALSGSAATRLQLRSSGNIRVTRGTGNEATGFVEVRNYRSGLFARHHEPMSLMEQGMGANADGLFAMSPFVAGRIELGFAKHLLIAGPSQRAPAGFLTTPAATRLGNIMIVDVIVDGVRTKAMIDTGSNHTIGNRKLQIALGFKPDIPSPTTGSPEEDATSLLASARSATIGNLSICGVSLPNPNVIFSDQPVFHALGLENGPALVLGIDQLSRLHALAIDYPRSELQVQP